MVQLAAGRVETELRHERVRGEGRREGRGEREGGEITVTPTFLCVLGTL